LDDAARKKREVLKRALCGIEGLELELSEIDQKLRVAPVTVEYANNPVQNGEASMADGAALGAVIGTFMLPWLGTVIGGAIGGIWGNKHDKDQALTAAIALDVKQTCETVASEAARVASIMKKSSDDIVDSVMKTHSAKANSPEGPDKDAEANLTLLVNDLTALASSLSLVRQGISERLA
jgi:hypothetical protein